MFTGLIEAVGEVLTFELIPGGARLVAATALASELAAGESLAVNGVCLTVVERTDGEAAFDLGAETLRVSTLGELAPGAKVNLERAMRADGRYGGHLVQGHVDGVGTITAVRGEGDGLWLSIRFPPALAAGFVPKGAVAVDGISLTVGHLGDDRFDVQVIPFTLAHTTLASARPGQQVNLECDIVGKYVARAVSLGVARSVEQPS